MNTHRIPTALLIAGLAALAIATPSIASAQQPYTVTIINGTFTAISGGSVYQPISYAQGYDAWDEGAVAIPLPFAFQWFGVRYTTIYAYTDGFLSFDPPPVGGGVLRPPSAVPDPGNVPHNFIAPMFTDLFGGPNAEIRALTQGTAPNRTFTVQLSGLQRFANPASNAEFQVKLAEASGSVQLIFGANNGLSNATTAIENADGTMGLNLLAPGGSCGTHCCLPRGCGSIDWPQGTTLQLDRPASKELVGTVSGPRGAYPGSSFVAHFSVGNVGQENAGAFAVQLRLSTDQTIDGSDVLLGTHNIAALLANTGTSSQMRVTMPAGTPVGRYYLGLIVDSANTVPEAIETNNTSTDPGGIVTAPDLQVQVDAPTSSGPGESIDVNLQIDSIGLPVAAPIDLSIYLSVDTTVGPGDVNLLNTSVTLPDGFSSHHTFTVTIPGGTQPSPPSYRILAVVDPNHRVTELDETNNTGASPDPLVLTVPDLETLSVTSGPVAFLGVGYPITTIIRNNGGTAARNFRVCAVISRNPVISLATDPILIRTTTITIPGNVTSTLRLEPLIPIATGTGSWNLAVVADCNSTLVESDETNNLKRRGDPIVIRNPAPDFALFQVLTASSGAAGETIPVSVGVGNYGNAAGAALVRIVVSDNPGITLQDPELYQTGQPVMLAPGQETVITVWAPIPAPIPSGLYYIGAIVDPDNRVDEVDETNNTLASAQIPLAGADLAIVTPAPPYVTIGVPFAWRFHAVGGSGSYVYALTWKDGHPLSGLSFDTATGELSGTATTSGQGRHDLTIGVTSGSATTSRDYSLLVLPPTLPLEVVSARLPPAIKGEHYSQSLVGVGGTAPYAWALTNSSTLPLGLALATDGTVGGEPSNVGAYTFFVSVQDVNGALASAPIALDVIDPAASISIGTADIPSGGVGMAYSTTFEAHGGAMPYSWSLQSQKIPGISFDAATAELAGTPTVAGSYPLVVEVRDAKGLFDRNAYVLEIFPPGNLQIVTGQGTAEKLPIGTVGVPYAEANGNAAQVKVANRGGGADPTHLHFTVLLGGMPAGLGIDPVTGVVAGTPTQAGVTPFTVLVTNDSGDSDRATLAIVVNPAAGQASPTTSGKSCGCSTASRGREGGAFAEAAFLIGALLLARRRGRRRV